MAIVLPQLTPAVVVSGLAALAHETRLALFRALVRKGDTGESAGELARLLEVPPQTLSFHLKEMARAGLLTSRRDGRHIYYAVDFEHVRQLGAYLTDSCCADQRGAGSQEKGPVDHVQQRFEGTGEGALRGGSAGRARQRGCLDSPGR